MTEQPEYTPERRRFYHAPSIVSMVAVGTLAVAMLGGYASLVWEASKLDSRITGLEVSHSELRVLTHANTTLLQNIGRIQDRLGDVTLALSRQVDLARQNDMLVNDMRADIAVVVSQLADLRTDFNDLREDVARNRRQLQQQLDQEPG